MSDVYLEALRGYLAGQEWRQSIDIFISSNCKYFGNIAELDHQQHSLWKTFQEIVETILEMALESVGGSLQQLEDAIDAVQRQPSRGPRENVVKDVLEQLLSFSDFHSFAQMMKHAHDSAVEDAFAQGKPGVASQHVDSMLRMGFPISAIEATLANSPAGASLEDLIIAVSAHDASQPRGASIASHSQGSSYHYDVHDSAPPSPRAGPGTALSAINPALLKFAKEAAGEGEQMDLNELNAKFAIADSVLESFDASARKDAGANGKALVALVRWAEDMKLLLGDLRTAYEEDLPCQALCFNCKDGLLVWFRELEATRLRIDEASVAGNMLSDVELRRMAELDRIAAMGTADEQLLHSLISRHDHVSQEVEGLQRQCGLLAAADRGRGIPREQLEELYLYLKQQVASGADLDALTDDLHEHVYGVVSSGQGARVVNLLLDLHVMEDEQTMLQKRIHSIVGSPGRRGPGAADGGQEEAEGLQRGRFFGEDQMAGTLSDAKDGDSRPDGTRAGDKDGAKNGNGPDGEGYSAAALFAADSKDHGSQASSVPDGSKGEPAAQRAEEELLGALKEKHRASLGQLRDLLDGEKARRLKGLEDKLLRRRALHQRTQQQATAGAGGSPGLDSLLEEQDRAVQEAEGEIEDAQMAMEAMAESMVSGLKKRCVTEMAAARWRVARGEVHSVKGAQAEALLTEQDLQEAHRKAAAGVKERFERDHRALLDSLEAERAKQRERVVQQLAAKRRKAGAAVASADTAAADGLELTEALVAMNLQFDAMQEEALGRAQESALMALAAIHLTDADLAAAQEDPDAYLEDGGDSSRGRSWLDKVGRVKRSYLTASGDLLKRLRAQTVAADLPAGGDSAGQGFAEVAALMSHVVTNAFDHHFEEACAEVEAAEAVTGSRKGRQGRAEELRADGARVRAGIMEEFERAKRQLEDGFLQAQKEGRSKLEQRRAKGKQESREGSAAAADPDEQGAELRQQKLQAQLERAVDDFVGGEPPPDLGSVYSTALRPAAPTQRGLSQSAAQARRDSQEWAEGEAQRERARIKSVHVEKEQSLLLALENSMADKKRALEDRLRRRRQSAPSTISTSGAQGQEAEEAEEAQASRLELAFAQARQHLRSLGQDQLGSLSAEALAEFLERSARGEQPPLPGAGQLRTNATLLRPLASPDRAQWEEGKTGDGTEEPLFSVGTGAGRRSSRGEKEAMAGEVRRISMEYSEEKQKLDLMMKIQQARQRQALQRKLFEKNQRKQAQMQERGPWEGEGEGPDGESSPADSKSDYNPIEIGANRGLAALKLRSPGAQQQAFKGLPAEAYTGGAPSAGGGAGYSSASKLQTQQSFALRGMNLGPMMRK